MEIGKTSGTYIGNGTTQDIDFSTEWNNLTIQSADRKYIMTFFKSQGTTEGQAAIGSGGSYRQLKVTSGGVENKEADDGFTVGDHVSINDDGTEYFWSVS